MRTKKIKMTSLVLASILLLSACGQTTNSNTNQTENTSKESVQASDVQVQESSEEANVPSYFNETGYPIVNEEITIKVLALKNASTTDFDNLAKSPAWEYISKLTGVKFEFEEYLKADLATKMPLIMADPDSMPDIFWRVNEADKNISSYASQGLFLDLDPYLEYMPNLQAAWESNSTYEYAARSVGGEIYTLPSYAFSYNPNTFTVNARWMKNCGIESYPTNLDEFKEMLIKFRDMDANGNGDPKDEYPMEGTLDSTMVILQQSVGILCLNPATGVAYGADEGSTEVYPVFMDERYRYVVEYFSELYSEGLVNKDMFTIDNAESDARKAADRYGVGSNKYFVNDYRPLPLLTSKYLEANKDGMVETAIVAPVNLNDVAMVSANTEYPEVCARILDYMYSLDGSALCGVADPAKYDLKAAGVSAEVLEIIDAGYSRTDGKSKPYNISGSYGPRWMAPFEPYTYTDNFSNDYNKAVYETLTVNYPLKGKVRSNFSNILKFTDEETEVLAQYRTDIDTLVKEKLTTWITGAEVLSDATWEAYIKQLKAMKVDELTAAYQSAYDRMISYQ